MSRTLAILGYHKVGAPSPGAWETWYLIPEAVFVSQLEFLKQNDWQVIDIATFLAGLAMPERLPARTALLTFDDGYRSLLGCAAARLGEFGYPGVVFVPTDFIGGQNLFDANTNQPPEAICSWDDLRDLDRLGFSIQSHGVSHRPFSELDPDSQRQELSRSKALLEDGLGKPVEFYSYPYGDSGINAESSQSLLRNCGYRAACLYGGGPNRLPVAETYRLTRLAMGAETDLSSELGQTS